jgi:menaquinone-dependent protoporphyrinogen oxidase
MEPNILIAYATRTGSTEEVARMLAAILRNHGLPADLLPVAEIHTLDPYTAVVICAPLYMGRLLKPMRRFLSEHRAVLAQVPVALFVLGPVQNEEKDWTGARNQLEKELRRYPWLTPVAQHIVGGRFDFSKLGFPYSLVPALKRVSPTDVRDWNAIREQAKQLAEGFGAGRLSHRESRAS